VGIGDGNAPAIRVEKFPVDICPSIPVIASNDQVSVFVIHLTVLLDIIRIIECAVRGIEINGLTVDKV
jgi:hypothetical protein